MRMNATILEAIEGPQGFTTEFGFSERETARIRQLIEEQWLQRIGQVAPGTADEFRERGIPRYHELASKLDHGRAWPKVERILPKASVDEIRTMSLFRRFTEEFGPVHLADEEEVGREQIYWRLVRPNEASDVGPFHCDRWFWDLGHGVTPAGVQRVKIWTAIVCEPNLSGLRVVPGSHRMSFPYHGEKRGGFVKPMIDVPESEIASVICPTKPGQAVIFHDNLLHGGAVSKGTLTRVNIEFTVFVPDEVYFGRASSRTGNTGRASARSMS